MDLWKHGSLHALTGAFHRMDLLFLVRSRSVNHAMTNNIDRKLFSSSRHYKITRNVGFVRNPPWAAFQRRRESLIAVSHESNLTTLDLSVKTYLRAKFHFAVTSWTRHGSALGYTLFWIWIGSNAFFKSYWENLRKVQNSNSKKKKFGHSWKCRPLKSSLGSLRQTARFRAIHHHHGNQLKSGDSSLRSSRSSDALLSQCFPHTCA